MKNTFNHPLPDDKGYFGEYGGSFIPEQLQVIMDEITEAYRDAIGSVVGPHPFPMMVRDFQSIVGNEAREQFQEMTGGISSPVWAAVRMRWGSSRPSWTTAR